MVSVTVKKHLLFNLIYATNLEFTDEVYEKAAELVEEKCDYKLIRPVNSKLRDELSVKFTLLKAGWLKLYTDSAREKYRRELQNGTFKVALSNDDVTQDTLIIKYKTCQKQLESTWAEKYQLESSLKKASSELKKMEAELERTKEFLAITKTNKDMELIAKMNRLDNSNAVANAATPSNDILGTLLGPSTGKTDLEVSNYVTQCLINARVERDLNENFKKMQNKHKKQNLTKPCQTDVDMTEDEECDTKKATNTKIKDLAVEVKRKPLLRKNYFKLSHRHKRRVQLNIKKAISDSLAFLEDMGLCLSNVEVSPVELVQEDFSLKVMSIEDIQHSRSPNVNNLLYYKDKFSISDKCYSDLKVCLKKRFFIMFPPQNIAST
jgi:hypothetical protein